MPVYSILLATRCTHQAMMLLEIRERLPLPSLAVDHAAHRRDRSRVDLYIRRRKEERAHRTAASDTERKIQVDER